MNEEYLKNLTENEKQVLQHINNHYAKRIGIRLNVKKIAHACNLNETQVREMLESFKEKKLIKKSSKGFFYVGDIVLELLLEGIGHLL